MRIRRHCTPWRGLLAVLIGGQALYAQSYEVAPAQKTMVPMRDGVRLATDIYRPARQGSVMSGRFPALLERTPYNKDRAVSVATAKYFVQHGYVVVFQDVRGRYQSEGKWVPIRDDPRDGFDTAKWIGAQSWCDGNIGTMGTSYAGATQHALAIAGAPYVKTMIPVDAMSNFGLYGVRHNGAFELRWFNWVFTMGNATGTPNAVPAAARAAADPLAAPALLQMGIDMRQYVRSLPLRPGVTPLKFAPDYENWLIEAMKHGDYDDFWKDHGASVVDHLSEYKDIPIYHVTGWYDSWSTQVANLNFVQLRNSKKSLQRLIIGPWTHSGQALNYAGEAQFTDDAALDVNAWRLRWFDRWLKGSQNRVDSESPVRIYVMGGGDGHKTTDGRVFVGGHWREEREWPLARAVATPYYLHKNGLLSSAAPANDPPTTYLFDPHRPVPTLGGNVSSVGELTMMGAADQRCRPNFWLCTDTQPLSARNDVLVYQTPPLASGVEVTGRLIVKLWATSDCPDTDFTAKLIDVYPPGRDFPAGVDLNVGDSIVRARYRQGPGKSRPLNIGEPYEFTIELYPTSLLFAKGHRIRLDVSSSNFPRFDVNPNTGEPLNDNRRWRIAANTIYADPRHPSQVILPVIPGH